MAPVLEARGLHKRYESDGTAVQALNGADLTVEPGEFLAVMGPSGCGKSTLLHLLGALDTPTDGEVLLEGRPLSGMSDAELTLVRRHRVGFVFQFFNLVPVLTVAENVALPAVIDGRHDPAQVDAVLARVGISELAGKLPTRLSGGEQQRVAVARALINEPAVVLGDEPTGNLDHHGGLRLMGVLGDCNRAGQTIVVVTHNPAIAAFATRVVLLHDGRVADEVRMPATGGADVLVAALSKLLPGETG
jgi:putative ABC transport system ATP-binding protein